ncbi:MAG: DUF1501 domain-containing protein [Gemmatimonadaceae bacterium]
MTARGYVTGQDQEGKTLVVIFLRGGADGLTLVPPVADDAYHRARPRLRVRAQSAIRLDDLFGLHPRLAQLAPLYASGELAIVHAVGSEDSTRSHFEAQDLMEHGGTFGGGWLGRFLRFRAGTRRSALAAIAWGTELPAALRGAPAATVMQSLGAFSLGDGARGMAQALRSLYVLERNALGKSGIETIEALQRLEQLPSAPRSLASDVDYPRDDFGNALQQTAMLIRARVGLEAATVDLGGWDSHLAQETLLEPLMERLARGLSAFHRDLGPDISRTTIVVMTEFGRRVAENSSFGTDHGRGSVMFALGGGVHGGRVLGRWPGLGSDVLDGPGDLPVRTNYRDVLAPIIARLGGEAVVGMAFPQFTAEPIPIFG